MLKRNDVFLDVFQIREFRAPSEDAQIDSARTYVAFIVDHTGKVDRLRLGSAEDVDAAVVKWGNIIRNGGDEIRTKIGDLAVNRCDRRPVTLRVLYSNRFWITFMQRESRSIEC